MRFFTSFLLISVFATCIVDGATRSTRPGSVTGAVTAKTQTLASQSAVRKNPLPLNPITGNMLECDVMDAYGNIVCIDPATKGRFVYDRDGNLAAQPVDPDDYVIPMLGVNVRTARTACNRIQADGYPGIFVEETHECLIPVVAHNWGGIIRVDGDNLVAWVPMGEMMKCNADLFEEVSVLRRSSQWVVPTMVVGGAGIGALTGALIDTKQNKKADKYDDLGNKTIIPFKDKWYYLSSEGKNGIISPETVDGNGTKENPFPLTKLVEDVKSAITFAAENVRSIQDSLNTAKKKVHDCAAVVFKELVTPSVTGDPKFGRIKITEGEDECDKNHNVGVTFCGYCRVNTGPNCVNNNNKADYPFNRIKEGRCYYRNGYGNVSADTTRNAATDIHRVELLKTYSNIYKDEVDTLANKFDANCTFNDGHRETYNSISLTGLTVKCKVPFRELIGGNEKCEDPFSNLASGNPLSILIEAQAIINVLEDNNRNKPNFFTWGDSKVAIDFIFIELEKIVNTFERFGDVQKDFGRERPFFQKAVGRGLLIGTGIGALAGLGYWFAEGASVFCNVGGFEHVKLNRNYSVPTFREYLLKNGYVTY
ncbi:MAG: hypothetical protein FWG80_04080 [Alphaproteobacteria bacterium]|nr:hypothetical protein [Alphaproteobacteria bacterium]